MKRTFFLAGILMLFAFAGLQPSTTVARSPITLSADDNCEFGDDEIYAVQEALADYLNIQVGEVIAHMASFSVKNCDETGWAIGTISLSYTGQPNLDFNWERSGGGVNIIVIWPE